MINISKTLVDNVYRRQENMGNVGRENEDTKNTPKESLVIEKKNKQTKTVAERRMHLMDLVLCAWLKKDSFN